MHRLGYTPHYCGELDVGSKRDLLYDSVNELDMMQSQCIQGNNICSYTTINFPKRKLF